MNCATTADRIIALESRLAQLEARIAQLESPITVYGPIPSTQTYPIPYNGLPGMCSVCGIKCDGPMGYVCPRGDCPTQVKCVSQVTP